MSTVDSGINDRFLTIAGAGSAVVYAVIFTVLGEIALESATYGAVAGLFAGVGTFLFLPWFLRLSALQDDSNDEIGFSETVRRADGNAQLGVVGLGLELGGIAMVAVGLSDIGPDLVSGTLVAVAIALVVALVASLLLNR